MLCGLGVLSLSMKMERKAPTFPRLRLPLPAVDQKSSMNVKMKID